jgi:lipopolysaccharide/colanic/teichoic acid biosynthesis glycosyltransferase
VTPLRERIKRAFDVSFAAAALLVLSPVLALIAVAVRIALGRPVLFRQQRPGRGGQPFTIVKFRTMKEPAICDGNPRPDAERLTRLGRFLRRTSLDEIPELYNVLRGEMSLVGPRPLLLDYVPLYSADQRRRHNVRPGITGWAQVNGRNAVSWDDKFAFDVWYVQHRSLWLDLKILGMTLVKVLKREGITGAGSETMEPFRGGQPTGPQDSDS